MDHRIVSSEHLLGPHLYELQVLQDELRDFLDDARYGHTIMNFTVRIKMNFTVITGFRPADRLQ